jgi:hypothetical protein
MNHSQETLDRDGRLVNGPGWCLFRCDSCEHLWKEPTRDCASPSGENCPRCGEWQFPYHAAPDSSLKTDALGNLEIPPEPSRTARRIG